MYFILLVQVVQLLPCATGKDSFSRLQSTRICSTPEHQWWM